jgi:LCP family protein required for cell wall assembly
MFGASRTTIVAFLGRFGIALVITSLVSVGIVVGVNHEIDDRVAKIKRVKLALAPAPPGGANFLIIGSDSRAFVDDQADANAFGDPNVETGQRSDTLMVAHVEPGSQRTVVVSFPRDLMVDVPGIEGKSMINAAYSTGGPQLVAETLDANFGIKINHYMEVDFKSFEAVVDAIGTVNIYVPGELRDTSDTGGTSFHSIYGAGCYAMNGNVALSYVRSRHMQIADPDGPIVDEEGRHWRLADANSDLDRIKRQQGFVRQLAAVAVGRALSDPFTAVELADNVLGYVKVDTGFGRSDANALVRAFRTVDVNDDSAVQFETIPTEQYPPDPNRLQAAPDADTVLDQLRTFGDNTPKPPKVPPSQVKLTVRDGTASLVAPNAARVLAEQGFQATARTPSTTTSSTRPELTISEIRFGANQGDAAKTVLDYVPDAKLVLDRSLDNSDHLVLVLGKSFSAVTVPSTTTTTTVPGVPGQPTTTTTIPPTTTSTTLPPNFCPN